MITPRALAVPALLLVLATACSAGTSSSPATPAPSSASSTSSASSASSTAPATSAPSSSAPSSAAPAAPAARALTLTVAGGKVTGDTGTVKVRVGEPLELTVHSDVADEVHVHGVDVGKDVAAGGSVVIDFTQTAPGRFEVELEGRKQVLTRLQVS